MFYLAVDGGRAPKTPHESIESATTEAEHLARITARSVSVYELVEVVYPPPTEDAPQEAGASPSGS